MKRGVVIGILVCVAAIVAFLALRTHDTASGTSSSGSGSATDTARASHHVVTRTGRRIAGIVIDDNNQPIAGAHVQLVNREGARAAIIVTSADGTFDFGPKAPLAYVVFADAAKLTGSAYELDLREPQTPSERLRIMLHPCNTSIHGVVRDTAGGNVAGARVSRSTQLVPSTTGAVSDATGAYELCVPTGGADLEVSADGYATFDTRVDVSGRTLRDFVLAPGATVTGKVVRASDKAPVDGAIVALFEKDANVQLFATSDENGAFTIDGVLPGRHGITASLDNLMALEPPDVAVEIGAPNDVTIEVSPVPSVSGRLVLTSDAKVGVAAMEVFLSPTTFGGEWQSVTSANDGTFVFERVLPGEYEAMIRGMAHEDRLPVHVADVNISGLVIETEAPSSVSGRVMYEGKPVEGAVVQARIANSQDAATTDSEGKFSFDGLVGDSVRLYAESSRVGAFTNGPTLTLRKGDKKSGIEINLDLAGSVAGVVIDQNNRPVPGVFIRFSLIHGNDAGQATTADDGSFTATAMSGGGEYVYEVVERADSPVVIPPADGKRFPPITVSSGSSHVTGLRVKVRRERLTISGRVVDDTGAGVPDATVRARPTGKAGYFFPPVTTTSDQTGAYVLRDLGRGKVSLSATASRGDSDDTAAEAGATNVIIVLEQLGNIDVTLDGFTGPVSVIAIASGRDARSSGARSGSTIHYRNVYPGSYTLMIYAQNDSWEDHVEVFPGKTATITLQPRALGEVDGRLVDASTKQPIADARCAGGDLGWKPISTDRTGVFHLTLVTGVTQISCWKEGYDLATRELTVVQNQAVHVDLTTRPSKPDETKKIDSGITFENQLKEIMVGSVAPNSPGSRAGVHVGDVVIKVDGETPGDASYLQYYDQSAGETMTLEVERGDKTLSLTVVFE